jgi:hypothetical protein
MVATAFVGAVDHRARGRVGDRDDKRKRPVEVEVRDVERRDARHDVALVIDHRVIADPAGEAVDEIMVAELWRCEHDRADAASAERGGVGELESPFRQRRAEAVTQH